MAFVLWLSVISRLETELTKLLHFTARQQQCCKWTRCSPALSPTKSIIVNFISLSPAPALCASTVFDFRFIRLFWCRAYFWRNNENHIFPCDFVCEWGFSSSVPSSLVSCFWPITLHVIHVKYAFCHWVKPVNLSTRYCYKSNFREIHRYACPLFGKISS